MLTTRLTRQTTTIVLNKLRLFIPPLLKDCLPHHAGYPGRVADSRATYESRIKSEKRLDDQRLNEKGMTRANAT
jgi:hypothetical protein